MKHITYLIVFVSMALSFVGCSKKTSLSYYNKESICIGTELDGSVILRSYGRGRNSFDAYNQAQKQAVYDILFNGIKKANSSCQCDYRPLLLEVNAKEKYESYFNVFFADGGDFEKYCNASDKKRHSTKYISNKEQTVCETTVTVDRAKLKERLIEDDIIK